MSDTWTGTVDAKQEAGQSTGFMVNKGDVITILASGWAERGPDKKFGPQGDTEYKPDGLTYPEAPVGALLMKIGDQVFPVNGGLFRWEVPVSGEIVFLFNDVPHEYGNNTGSFNVSVGRDKASSSATPLWTGNLPSNAEQGVRTGVTVKKGDVITIKVTGLARYQKGGELFGPEGIGQVSKNGFIGASVLGRIGGLTVQVGSGFEQWVVPVDGDLSFIYNDFNEIAFMRDNEGSFDIVVTTH